MSTVQAIKQLEEKNVASEIVLMVWSDRMDLVALANVKGEVALHRLTWTKAWNLSPPKDGVTVKGISWRPDGKIIAIAYSCGQVILVKVENKCVLHSIDTQCDISCIYWTQDKATIKGKTAPAVNEESRQKQYMKFIDVSSNFLPEPSSQNFDSTTTNDDSQKNSLLQDQNELNLLLIGTTDGIVHVQIFGCFSCTVFNLSSYLNTNCSIESIHLTEGLSKMLITTRDANNNIKIVFLNSDIFKTHTDELFAVALKHIKLTSLVNYLSNTITTITESWESILLEMDNKLSKYASKVPEGGVTADFLDLLMFGICSDEMKEFLIHDLTKKGLEKFGQTIEMSYSNIQKLMLKYVMKFGQNITYHLAEMRGMARMEHRYKILGLSESEITQAILANGAFMIKGGEMQQIINHSIINYKAFFRWLYTAIMHVMDEPIPNEIPKMTQQDLAYITEFLQNFDHIGSRKGFIMERLGQYLQDSNLTIKPDMSNNEWTYFLSQNQCVQNHQTVLKHFEDMSLIQQYKHLKNSIDDIFQSPKDYISRLFEVLHVFNCFQYSPQVLKMTQINLSTEIVLFAFLQPPENVLSMQIHIHEHNCFVKCCSIYFSQFLTSEQDGFDGNYNIVDIKLYSNTIISVLLQENTTSKLNVLYQVPLTPILEKFSEVGGIFDEIFKDNAIARVNGSNLLPKLYKNIEGMSVASFAVSGSRRVGIVLAENKRKVRLYEMEGEEEEDEDADMNSTMKDEIQEPSNF